MEKNLSFSCEGLNEINFKTAWPQVEIIFDSGSEIRLLIVGDDKTVAQIKTELKDGVFLLEQPQYGIIKSYTEGTWIQIFAKIPEIFKGALSVNSISGHYIIKNYQGSWLYADSISGDLYLNDIKAEQVRLNTISATLTLRNVKIDDIKVKNVSGKLIMENASINSISTSSISGQQRLELIDKFNKFSSSSVSGNIEISSPAKSINIKIASLAGKVVLDNVSESQEENDPEVKINIVTGNIRLKRN